LPIPAAAALSRRDTTERVCTIHTSANSVPLGACAPKSQGPTVQMVGDLGRVKVAKVGIVGQSFTTDSRNRAGGLALDNVRGGVLEVCGDRSA